MRHSPGERGPRRSRGCTTAAGKGFQRAVRPQAARISTEWRRWEEADKWSWDAGKRRRWAERLWRGQILRHGARVRARADAAAAAARQRVDVRRPPARPPDRRHPLRRARDTLELRRVHGQRSGSVPCWLQ